MVSAVYAGALAQLAGLVRLAGVVGRGANSGMAFLARHPALAGARACGTLTEALALDPDFAILATPPNARAELVAAWLARSVPNEAGSGALGRLTVARPNTTAIERELDRTRSPSGPELRLEWQRLNRSAPLKLGRDLLALALGYQLQEREHGRLSKSTRRKLQNGRQGLAGDGPHRPGAGLEPQARRATGPRMAWTHPYEGELFEMVQVHVAGGAGTKQLIERAGQIAEGLTDNR